MLQLRQGLKQLPLQPDLQALCCWLSDSNPGSPEYTPLSPAQNHDTRHVVRNLNKTDIIPVSENELCLAEQIWDYMTMGHEPKKSDVILVLGNNDIRVAEYAADLYNSGLGEWLLLSGKDGNLTKGKWTRTEAEVFRDVAVAMGVPENKILLETRATNTGENIKFSYQLLQEKSITVRSITLVQCPYMERRTYATFIKQWPTTPDDVRVTSPPITLVEYPNHEIGSLREVISIMLGCLQRIVIYPRIGYQIAQEIPPDVREAYLQLVATERFNDFIVKI